jgi:tetratricopeptide (TPR) repeat protein
MESRRPDRDSRRLPGATLAAWGVLLVLALPAAGQRGDGTAEALELAMLDAETALGQREHQIAESHYRAALLEGWYLLGRIAAADGDAAAAEEALERAARAQGLRVLPQQRDAGAAPSEIGEEPSAGRRAVLRGRVAATLARVYRNLGAMQEWAGSPGRAAGYRAEAEAVAAGAGSQAPQPAFGRVDLDPEPPPPVDRQRLDPAELREAAPAGLDPVVLRIDAGRLDEAEEELRRALAERDDPAARDLLGAVLSHQGRYPEAEAELRAAVAASPGRLPARQHLARVLLWSGRRGEAVEELRQAAELGPLERDLAFELAAVERAAGRKPAANHQLRSLVRRFGSARASIQLAEIATDLRRTKQALGHAERALAAAPSSEEALALHTRCALAARIPSTAAKSVEPLARMHPEVAEYRYLLGRVWIGLRNLSEAAEALLEAVRLDPGLEAAYVPLGQALNHERRYDGARTYLRRFLDAHPDDLDAAAALAEAEERLGDTETAERRAEAVLERDGDHPGAQLVIAMLHMREGRFAEARAALEKAVAADPDGAKAHYQLSQACARLGDADCARRHLELYKNANLGPEGDVVLLDAERQDRDP